MGECRSACEMRSGVCCEERKMTKAGRSESRRSSTIRARDGCLHLVCKTLMEVWMRLPTTMTTFHPKVLAATAIPLSVSVVIQMMTMSVQLAEVEWAMVDLVEMHQFPSEVASQM